MSTKKISKKIQRKAKLPFVGCYGTLYDLNELEPDKEVYSEEYMDEYWDKNFNAGYWLDCLGKEYVRLFNEQLKEILKTNENCISFESTSSPKQYNFYTDCIFVNISDWFYQELIRYALAHEADFGRVVTREFSPTAGFVPFYSNNIANWLEKLLQEKPLNQIEIYILIEVLILKKKDEILDNIYEDIRSNTELLEVGSSLYTDEYLPQIQE